MGAQSIKLREHGRVSVFISHIWARDVSYRELESALSKVLGTSFRNLSVPTSEALAMLSVGPNALAEERRLQTRHLEYCRNQIEITTSHIIGLRMDVVALKDQLADLQRGIRAVSEIPKVESRVSRSLELGLGERMTRSEIIYLEELRNLANRVPQLGNVSHLERSIEKLSLELNKAEVELRSRTNEADDREHRISILNRIEDPENFNKYHHPDVLFRALSSNNSVQRLHPNLALELYYRIRMADVVVVLASAHDMHREWMNFENSLSIDLHKPFVIVKACEDSGVPPELVRLSKSQSIRLDEEQIRSRLFELMGREVADSVLFNPHP